MGLSLGMTGVGLAFNACVWDFMGFVLTVREDVYQKEQSGKREPVINGTILSNLNGNLTIAAC